jgi:hypothetical protein
LLIKQIETEILDLNWRFTQAEPVVLAVKSARTCDYSETRSLNLNDDARIYINPDLSQSHLLADWIQSIDPRDMKFNNKVQLY